MIMMMMINVLIFHLDCRLNHWKYSKGQILPYRTIWDLKYLRE